jgi:hypothetical protein
VEIVLLAFTLGLVMESLAASWLVIPTGFFLNLAVLLSYYTFTDRWGEWFWWPLMLLEVTAESWYALRWMGRDPLRARQLGRAAAILAAGLVVFETLVVIFIMVR